MNPAELYDSTLPFDAPSTAELLVGFRLQRLEVLNWGTFDSHIWRLELNGRNGLLTGDIGSGKSTLVDALTTLLLPAHRIAYNKAAGADGRERNLRTYVLGRFGALRNEDTGAARPQELRKAGTYSVILGVFHNEGFAETISLAQVFWFKDPQAQPERLYVCTPHPLSIGKDLSRIGPDMGSLRKRLRQQEGVEVFDTFTDYAATFRRRFHVPGEQAWELFHQTVSMKSVGNLTDFVREHMLEAPEIDQRIADLLQHFEDLTAAHAAVVKAKNMVVMLKPLVEDLNRYETQTAELRFLRICRDHLRPYFAALKVRLLEARLLDLAADLDKWKARLELRQEKKAQELDAVVQLKQAIADQGGDRLEQLDLQLERQRKDLRAQQMRARQFEDNLGRLALPMSHDDAAFEDLQKDLVAALEQAETRNADLTNRKVELSVDFRTQLNEHTELQREIVSLGKRPSNIPDFHVQLRARLAQELNISAEELPFAGELLQVKPEETEWEGALERLLHSFALSLLVRDDLYSRAERWVNRTHLKGLLVYLHVRPRFGGSSAAATLAQNAAAHKLEVKAHPAFAPWLRSRLRERFDVACLAEEEDFQRANRALSLTGQIKLGEQHTKDDRRRIDDRSNYVLGWSSTSKIAALQQKASTLERSMQAGAAAIGKIDDDLRATETQRQAVRDCRALRLFEEMNWGATELLIREAEQARQRLESSSDILAELRAQLGDAQTLVAESDKVVELFRRDIIRTDQKLETAQLAKANAEILQAPTSDDVLARLEQVQQSEQREELTADNADTQEHLVREEFHRRIDAEDKQVARIKDRILLAMQNFRTAYPLDTAEMDSAMEAQGEYRRILDQLTFHDLPRFEDRFQQELRKNTIQRIGSLNAEFDRQGHDIMDRLAKINESLVEIDYNPGRYIRLTHQKSFHPEIQQFRDDLRACTDNEVHGSINEPYAEAKFNQVKRILDRLRGRPEFGSEDRRWRALVTDVRNWYSFAASERWQESDKEFENHSDTSGKSGGQKEQLAYTVLAASLAYQFGLDWGEERSRRFRFVVIDEAFGRGSEASAKSVNLRTGDFATDYGFLREPSRVRFRMLDPQHGFADLPGCPDVELDSESFAALRLNVTCAIIVENKTTYLVFPPVANAIAIFGAGYALRALAQAAWLRTVRLIYWGDIDTHGFNILSQLREFLPHAESMLMDKATLSAMRDSWTSEPAQSSARPLHLVAEEQELLQALQAHEYGERLRLEQEKIPLRLLLAALSDLNCESPESKTMSKQDRIR